MSIDHRSDPVQGFSPAGQLLHLIGGYWITQAIQVAAELGIADLLGRKGRDIDELARATNTHAPSLYRLLRALASVDVFAEVAPRSFALTPMGVLLREDTPGNLRAFSRFQGEAWHWGCWGDLLHTVRTGQTAIAKREGVANCFDYFARNPASAQVFNAAMSGYATHVNAAIIDAYDFSAARCVVDIGGGTGTLLSAILACTAEARGVLLDRPQVIAAAQPLLEALGSAPRCECIAGDFFSTIPQGGDLYVLCAVLHDWDDADVTRILRSVSAAMAPAARLLIVEHLLTPNNEADPAKFIDLEMMLIAGGRERTEEEYVALLRSANLHCERVVPTAMPVSILEARLD
ncbi:MAG: methyltransferase [Burkholderiales bacterium]